MLYLRCVYANKAVLFGYLLLIGSTCAVLAVIAIGLSVRLEINVLAAVVVWPVAAGALGLLLL